jgi:hypothetical protein
MICNSLFLKRLSCNTFLMATTSSVSTTLASKTTPNDPLPIMRSALYEIFCSPATAPTAVAAAAASASAVVPAGMAEEDAAAPLPIAAVWEDVIVVTAATLRSLAEELRLGAVAAAAAATGSDMLALAAAVLVLAPLVAAEVGAADIDAIYIRVEKESSGARV